MKPTASLTLITALLAATQAGAVDFKSQIFPLLNQKCSECHSASKKVKGKFDIGKQDNYAKHIKAGQPDVSGIVLNVTAPDDDDDVMPPKGKNRLTPPQVAMLKQWIQEGASFTAGGAAPAPAAPSTAAPGAPAAAASAAQKWTNTTGAVIEATFEGMDGTDFVLLKVVSTGIVHKVPLANLSAESQALAKNGGK